MKARRKEIRRESLEAFAVKPRLKFLDAEVQVRPRLRTTIDGSDAPAAAARLAEVLRNRARQIP
jgi:electron transfer flavoprotein beta subunit